MIPGNPFRLVYEALWDLAEASAPLTDTVKLGNRIRFDHTDYFNPIKEEVSDADLPELVLVATATSGNMHETSSSSRINVQYEWLIATGDMSVVNALLPVTWYLWAAMANWREQLGALRWPAAATDGFVKRTQFLSANTGLTDSQRNRGIVGWSSVWAIEVEMHFATSDLVEVGVPTTTGATTT